MIRHHQGALVMADYAVRYAVLPQTHSLAARIAFDQSQEITRLSQILLSRGVDPSLPPPG